MNEKKPIGIKVVTMLSMICGLYNIVFSFGEQIFFSGLLVILLGIGVFKISNIARIATILFSILFILFYSFLIFVYIKSGSHYGWGVGLVFYFPLLVWSIVSLIILNIPAIRTKFH